MLIGRRLLQECPSSSVQQAYLRFGPSNRNSRNSLVAENVFRTQTVTIHDATRTRDGRKGGNIAGCHSSLSSIRRAALSTTAQLAARPRNRESKFLKPYGKPKFRQLTREENNEVLTALDEAQAQYEAQYRRKDETKSIQDDASFTSPFLANTDYNTLNDNQRIVPQNNVDRSSRPPQHSSKTIYRARRQASTNDLESELHYLAQNDPNPIAIHSILKILIHGRKIKPTHNYYEALILANAWPEYGSVENIERILSEMDRENVEVGANIISAVIKVLAIHPSPELSHRMLTVAERRWIQLSTQATHHLIAGMIRTGQTELAAYMLDVLRQKGKSVRSWDRETIPDYLVVLLMVEMVKIEDWEGVLRYVYKLRNRRAADREIPVEFWSWLLHMASKSARDISEIQSSPLVSINDDHNIPHITHNEPASHMNPPQPEATTQKSKPFSQSSQSNTQVQLSLSNPAKWLAEFMWTFYVAPMSIRPSWSTCLNILHTAANTGTAWLADSVLATMTYLDGIDEQGRPKATINNEVTELVEKAKTKADAGRDIEKEEASRNTETKRAAQAAEEDVWWEELFQLFREEEKVKGGGSVDKLKEEVVVPAGPESSSKEISGSDRDSSEIPNPSDSDVSSQFQPFDPATAPPGNLWPLFPSIGNLDSARVDPWEALGPRSAVRRKWTEAQERFKRSDRGSRKKY